MVIIECPRCSAKTSFSLAQSVYEGPLRCWKCRGLFTVRIEDKELKSCKPLSEEEFEKGQQAESFDTSGDVT